LPRPFACKPRQDARFCKLIKGASRKIFVREGREGRK